jgi:hypothetical protein
MSTLLIIVLLLLLVGALPVGPWWGGNGPGWGPTGGIGLVLLIIVILVLLGRF